MSILFTSVMKGNSPRNRSNAIYVGSGSELVFILFNSAELNSCRKFRHCGAFIALGKPLRKVPVCMVKVLSFCVLSNCYCAPISLSVCLCVCVCLQPYLWNRWTDLHEIFCADPLWPWFAPSLAALRYVMYFRF